MSAISQILEKIDELCTEQDGRRERLTKLNQNLKEAEKKVKEATDAVESHEELDKHIDDKICMLRMIATALKQELDAKTEAAKQYFASIDDAEEGRRFIDFMVTQDVDLNTRINGLGSEHTSSTPEPET